MAKQNRVTIKDIAREVGVSVSLVSFVMSNQASGTNIYRVSPETSRRVLEVAKKLNYKPNNSARTLRSGKTNTIGVLLSDIANPFFAEMARQMEDTAAGYGYSVIFGSTDENPEKLGTLIDVFIARGIDGLIIVPCADSAKFISQKIGQIPIVLVDRSIDSLDVDSVVLDNYKAGREITDILLQRGCRKVQMMSYAMTLSNTSERERGYMDSMTAAGLEPSVKVGRFSHNHFESVGDFIDKAREDGVDGLVFATNTIATQALTYILGKGLRIPEDFAVASFDSNPAFDIYRTDIVFVRQPVASFACCAIEQMLKRITGSKNAPVHMVLSPEIVK